MTKYFLIKAIASYGIFPLFPFLYFIGICIFNYGDYSLLLIIGFVHKKYFSSDSSHLTTIVPVKSYSNAYLQK